MRGKSLTGSFSEDDNIIIPTGNWGPSSNTEERLVFSNEVEESIYREETIPWFEVSRTFQIIYGRSWKVGVLIIREVWEKCRELRNPQRVIQRLNNVESSVWYCHLTVHKHRWIRDTKLFPFLGKRLRSLWRQTTPLASRSLRRRNPMRPAFYCILLLLVLSCRRLDLSQDHVILNEKWKFWKNFYVLITSVYIIISLHLIF